MHPDLRAPYAALALCFLSAPAAAQDFDLYWADRWNDVYHRFSDQDGNGSYSDAGEVSFLITPGGPLTEPPASLRVRVEDGRAVAYWLAEFDDTVMRGVDEDGNGHISGSEEIGVFRDSGMLDGESWPQDIALTDDGAVWWAAALVISNPQNGISRLEDLNADGDAADPGEQVVMVDGTGAPLAEHDLGTSPIEAWALSDLAAAGNGVIAYSSVHDLAAFRFEDLNQDGDVTDAGESVLLLNATGENPALPTNPDFFDGTLKSMLLQNGGKARFTHLASAVEGGERVFYFATDANAFSPDGSTNVDGEGVNFLIFRGVDGNGDRDVNDAGEVTLFVDGSHTGPGPNLLTLRALDVADGGAVFAVGLMPYPVLFPGPNGNTWIHRFDDANSDGDALDPGEQTLNLFDLQAHGVTPFFPNPPTFGNVMADPYDLAVSDALLFEPAFTVTGSGCSSPSGSAPSIGGSGSGLLGSSFDFLLTGAEPTSLALWSLGTSTTLWAGLPLPLDLGPFGYVGCTLYQNLAKLEILATDGSGAATYGVVIPTSPSLSGALLPVQWIVLGASGATQLTALGELLVK